ncbi:hypothetical protein ACEWY4_017250 [Coilia grayii]|uniref:Sema domain-containing protein n=1 Tax=Coilia grayii TaxID=363190 RepID=A0ABD1JHH4_9TELE
MCVWGTVVVPSCTNSAPFWSTTDIQTVAQDPRTGRLYVGATDNLFQLNADLAQEHHVVTGPRLDHIKCSPPISRSSCSDAEEKSNKNRLLLVYPEQGSLIACGSVYQGLCSLLNLTNITHTLFYSETGGQKTWVARGLYSIVGLVSKVRFQSRTPPLDVLVVAKHYHETLHGTDFLSMRRLQGDGSGGQSIFTSVAEMPFAGVDVMQGYSHQFYKMFRKGGFTYIVFSRLRHNMDKSDTKQLTFVARFCTDDIYFYSYVELQLVCGTDNRTYAANVAPAGAALAKHLSESEKHGKIDPTDMVLFGVFGTELGHSELCLYPLSSVDRAFEEIRTICYDHQGVLKGQDVVYQPYSGKQDNPCRSKNFELGMAVTYPCGDATLPDQLAGSEQLALHSQSVLTWPGVVTAVAVAVEPSHTLVLLGTKDGEVLKVEMAVPLLPALTPGEELQCVFGSRHSTAHTQGTHITCPSPDPSLLQCNPQDQDYVYVPVKIRVVGGVELVTGQFRFYSCAAVVKAEDKRPDWGCQWDTEAQACSDMDQTAEGANIIKHQQIEKCPVFENPTPALISVGVKTPISFVGRNLIPFTFDKAQELNVSLHISDTETGKRTDSNISVLLYNCSVERHDCSLCQSVDTRFGCVWCSGSQMCVYRELCTQVQHVCPRPAITDISPRSGPMEGQISITILGSNLGVRPQDIQAITVAKVPCTHQPDRYSTSTRVVCEIGPVQRSSGDSSSVLGPVELELRGGQRARVVCEIGPVQRSSGDSSSVLGPVELELRGGQRVRSSLLFTYQDPAPKRFSPTRSFNQGGRIMTITGSRLDTGSRDDLRVLVGGEPCSILSVEREITCKVPAYENCYTCPVVVKYGKNTTKELDGEFKYAFAPFLLGHNPKHSFACGGRVISINGFPLHLVDKATLSAVPPAGDPGADQRREEEAFHQNFSTLLFRSPDVRAVRDLRPISVFLHLDGLDISLTPFTYHPDPVFNALSPNPISASNTVTVTAMTVQEAEAFIGNVSCHIISLKDDRLVLQVPPTVIERRQHGEMEPSREVKDGCDYANVHQDQHPDSVQMCSFYQQLDVNTRQCSDVYNDLDSEPIYESISEIYANDSVC